MKKYSLLALYLFFGESLVRAIGFFTNVYIARTLNPEILGFIAVGSSLLTYSLLVSDSGIKTLGFLETAKPESDRLFSFSEIVNAKIVHGILSFVFLAILTFIIYNTKILRIICIFYLFNIFYDSLFVEWYYNGLQKFKIVASARIIASTLYIILLVLYVKTPAEAANVPLYFFLSNLCSVIILLIFLPTTQFTYKFSFSLKKYIDIVKQSIPLGIGIFFNMVPIYLPPVLLDKFVNSKQTGVFWVSLKIVSIMMIVDKIFSTIFMSALPKMWIKNSKNATQTLQSILNFGIAFGFLFSLMICVFSEPIIALIYGEKYMESSKILSILSWFFSFTIINSIFVYGLIAIGQKKQYLKAAAAGFFLNCIFISILIFFCQTYGAAVSVVLGEIIFVSFCYYEFNKFSPLKFYSPLLKVSIASIISILMTFLLDFNTIINSLIAITVYGIFTLLLSVIKKNDYSLLNTKWKKN
ncbi:MAG: oligosaccharide flippase family protein [Chitinispirillia bacterium]|jgi:O-antigen/teichoic acid export membrane protein